MHISLTTRQSSHLEHVSLVYVSGMTKMMWFDTQSTNQLCRGCYSSYNCLSMLKLGLHPLGSCRRCIVLTSCLLLLSAWRTCESLHPVCNVQHIFTIAHAGSSQFQHPHIHFKKVSRAQISSCYWDCHPSDIVRKWDCEEVVDIGCALVLCRTPMLLKCLQAWAWALDTIMSS